MNKNNNNNSPWGTGGNNPWGSGGSSTRDIEDSIKKAKERYELWRIGILEEVARMKLKKKVDNIDKAGLSEILNG